MHELDELRDRLCGRAFLFDDPSAFVAGVTSAVEEVKALLPRHRPGAATDRQAGPVHVRSTPAGAA